MKLFIGTSSSEKIDKKYLEGSKELLDIILKDNDLVFGYCDRSIMRLSYDIAVSNNNKVIASLPQIYDEQNDYLKVDEKYVCNSMMQSTEKIISESDAFIMLPGGFGTIFEIFSFIQTKISKDHNKKVIIYNMYGFYDNLIKFIDDLYNEKFAELDKKDKYYIANTKEEVIKFLNEI